MNVDNFDLIKSLFNFDDDSFYFLQIIIRRKDSGNESIGADSIVIKSYYISSMEYLDKKRKEIKKLCVAFHARAYINLTRRNYEKAALFSLRKHAESLLNKEYKCFPHIYDSACGEITGSEKRWVVDIDYENMSNIDFLEHEINKIELNNPSSHYPVVICRIPTPFGAHLITHPFNLKLFDKYINLYNIDIHKNNPTVLFYEESKQ